MTTAGRVAVGRSADSQVVQVTQAVKAAVTEAPKAAEAQGNAEAAKLIARASALLDRGWGKAAQPHTGEDDKDIRVTGPNGYFRSADGGHLSSLRHRREIAGHAHAPRRSPHPWHRPCSLGPSSTSSRWRPGPVGRRRFDA